MAITYEPLANTVLSSSSLSITLGGIPNTYTDLRLVATLNDASGSTLQVNFNGDEVSGSTYNSIRLLGNGTSASSANFNGYSSLLGGVTAYTAGIYNMHIIDILSYASSFYKNALMQSYDQNSGQTRLISGAWNSTAPITSIKLSTDGGSSFIAGTTVTLYGILKA